MRQIILPVLRFSFALYMTVASGLPTSAQEPTLKEEKSPTPPTADCALFSMEGIRPGMTLEEVRAIGVQLKERHAFVPANKRGKVFRFRGEKHDGDLEFGDDGTVKTVSVNFMKSGLLWLKLDVDYDTLVKILSERWGGTCFKRLQDEGRA